MSDIIRRAIFRNTFLPGGQERAFQNWYAEQAKPAGLDPSPDAPEHQYDWRAAYLGGATPEPADDGYYHWPSRYKKQGHPNRFIDGMDTLTGQPQP